jgi:hypothetical protein
MRQRMPEADMTPLLLAMVALMAISVGCGDDSSGGGTNPSPTTSAVVVNVATPLRIGQVVQASGTATLSNGQTQAVTSGWQSDVPGVATVTTAGQVTGVANGRANIYVVSGGQQGQAGIRVVPDFQGSWTGRLLVSACSQSGVFAQINFCNEFPVSSSDPFAIALAQTGESMTARANYGDSIVFTPVEATIQPDGGASFVTTWVSTSSPITIQGSWSINGPRTGELVGTVTEVWRSPGQAGEATLTQSIVSVTRTSTTALVGARGGQSSRKLPLTLGGGRSR